jgi:hypothetical protein
MRFKKWVQQMSRASIEPAAGAPPLGRANRSRLQHDLRQSSRRNEFYFRLSIGLAVLLALATVAMALANACRAHGALAPTALGISAAGAVCLVIRFVQEKHLFDTMLELATGLDERAMTEVLAVLMKKYSGSKSA